MVVVVLTGRPSQQQLAARRLDLDGAVAEGEQLGGRERREERRAPARNRPVQLELDSRAERDRNHGQQSPDQSEHRTFGEGTILEIGVAQDRPKMALLSLIHI